MDTISVVVGALIGVVLSSIVWGLAVVSSKKQQEKTKEQRDQKINSIAEILIEIDALVTSNRSGQLKSNSFKTALPPKIEAINKILKSSMHNLDVYYVKYVESLLDQYNKLVYGLSVASTPVILEDPEIKTEDTAEFIAEKIPADEEFTIKEPVSKVQEKESGKPAFSEKTSDAENPLNQPKSKIEPEKVSKQILPATVDTKEKIIEKTSKENEISEKELLFSNFEKEFQEAARFEQSGPAGINKNDPEEEFAVETIMDFDLSNIKRMKQAKSKTILGKNGEKQWDEPQFEVSGKQIISKSAEEKVEVEAQLEDFQPQLLQKGSHHESEIEMPILKPPVKSSPKSSQPAQKKEDKEVLPAIQDEQEFDLTTFFEIQSAGNDQEKKDVNITGDDIADQIDSFFNIKKK